MARNAADVVQRDDAKGKHLEFLKKRIESLEMIKRDSRMLDVVARVSGTARLGKLEYRIGDEIHPLTEQHKPLVEDGTPVNHRQLLAEGPLARAFREGYQAYRDEYARHATACMRRAAAVSLTTTTPTDEDGQEPTIEAPAEPTVETEQRALRAWGGVIDRFIARYRQMVHEEERKSLQTVGEAWAVQV
jgi:hypothetical protein